MRLDLAAPHTVYKNSKGKRLTGVTTYLKQKNKEALPGWYAAQEREGVVRYLRDGRPLPTKKDGKPLWFAEASRDRSADLGTVVHFRSRCWIDEVAAETQGIPPDLWSDSQHGFDRFRFWYEAKKFRRIASEKVLIYEDPDMEFGGTADYFLLDDVDRKVELDLKTTKFHPKWPFDEVVSQTSTYAVMEHKVSGVPVDGVIAVRIGKAKTDEVQDYELKADERIQGWRIFRAAYEMHEASFALERLRA